MRSSNWLVAICIYAGISTTALAAPTARIESGIVRILPASNAAESTASMVLIVEDLDTSFVPRDGSLAPPAAIAAAEPMLPKLVFETPISLSGSETRRRWLLPFRTTGMPADTEQTRYAEVTIGKHILPFQYHLSSKPAPTVNWSLKSPAASRSITPDGVVALSISGTGALPIGDLRLGSSEFIEQSTKRALAAGQLSLCQEPSPCATKSLDLDSNGGIVYLSPRLGHEKTIAPTLWPGKYEGTITIASRDKPAGESTSLTIYVTSVWWQLLGFFLLTAGIASTWYFTTFLRRRLAREQLLVPAVALRSSIDVLDRRIAALSFSLPCIAFKLDALDQALSDACLEQHGLPAAVPEAAPTTPTGGEVDLYKTYLQKQHDWLSVLAVLVEDGVRNLTMVRESYEATQGNTLNDTRAKAFRDAVASLDQIAKSKAAPALPEVATQIALLTTTFENALGPRPLTAPAAPREKNARSTEKLRLQIAAGNTMSWVFVGAVTALAGLYVLVLSNPGFGTPIELLGCFLWGVGLPASTLVASATTDTVTARFSVSR